MAGIDFDIMCSSVERPLVKGLLSLLQNRSKRWGLEFRYKYHKGVFNIGLHGSLPALQAFVNFLVQSETLQVFASGFPEPISKTRRVQIARNALSKIVEMTVEVTGMGYRMVRDLGGFANSYLFDAEGLLDVEHPLISFSGILMLYHNGYTNTTPVIEAGHTALETLLKKLVGDQVPQGTKNRFQKMLVRVVEKHYLTDESKVTLSTFNSLRTEAKHDGRTIGVEELELFLPKVVESCHLLLTALHGAGKVETET
jgi:hypothetical protein